MILNFIVGFSVPRRLRLGKERRIGFKAPLVGLNGPRVSTPGVNAWATEKSLKLGH